MAFALWMEIDSNAKKLAVKMARKKSSRNLLAKVPARNVDVIDRQARN